MAAPYKTMLRQISESDMIITPHSLYHLLVNFLSAECLFVCLFLFCPFSAINGLHNLAPPCKGPCIKKYSLKHLLFSVHVGSGMNIT